MRDRRPRWRWSPPGGRRRLLAALGALGAAAVVAPFLEPARRSGPLRHEAYVWQYAWTDAVRRAVSASPADVAGLVVLGAEVRWSGAGHVVRQIAFDPASLREAGGQVGIGVRVHALASSPTRRDAEVVAAAARQARERAEEAGLEVREVQIDFDCASSQLDAYARWVGELRGAAGEARLTVTALPSWLGRRGFEALAARVDGYVLQVHGIEERAGEFFLFDLTRARQAVARAGALGAPFRLALPTYAYQLALDEAGRPVGVSAEGPGGSFRSGLRVLRLRADPAEVAALVRELAAARPRAMEGVVWYRLPVAGDELNASLAELRAVMRGQAPAARLRLISEREEPGLWSVALRNEGDGEAERPASVRLRWRGGKLVASDALGGFVEQGRGEGELRLRPEVAGRIGPGEQCPVAWLRFEGDVEEIELDG